jgi:hypothetical protein
MNSPTRGSAEIHINVGFPALFIFVKLIE